MFSNISGPAVGVECLQWPTIIVVVSAAPWKKVFFLQSNSVIITLLSRKQNRIIRDNNITINKIYLFLTSKSNHWYPQYYITKQPSPPVASVSSVDVGEEADIRYKTHVVGSKLGGGESGLSYLVSVRDLQSPDGLQLARGVEDVVQDVFLLPGLSDFPRGVVDLPLTRHLVGGDQGDGGALREVGVELFTGESIEVPGEDDRPAAPDGVQPAEDVSALLRPEGRPQGLQLGLEVSGGHHHLLPALLAPHDDSNDDLPETSDDLSHSNLGSLFRI